MSTTRAAQIECLLTPVIDHRSNSVASGYTAYFYSAGTSSPKNVWTEKEKTNPYTSRTLGSDGTIQVYGDGVYKIIIKDTDGTTVHTWDNIKVQANTFTVQTKSDTYTATADDDLILCSGTFTVNIATVTGFTHPLIIKRVSGTITVDPYSTQTIDGSSTITLDASDDSAVLYPDVVAGVWRRANRLAGLDASVDEINSICVGAPNRLIATANMTVDSSYGSEDTLNLGTLTLGDVFVVYLHFGGTKGGTAGENRLGLSKSSGTGDVDFFYGLTAISIRQYIQASAEVEMSLIIPCYVSTSGTYILSIDASSAGSDTSSGEIMTIVLFNKKQ